MNAIERKFKMKLTKENATMILDQLKKDCKFFEECSIIDYSLLIGVHHINQNRQDSMNIEESSVDFMSLKNSRIIVIFKYFFLKIQLNTHAIYERKKK